MTDRGGFLLDLLLSGLAFGTIAFICWRLHRQQREAWGAFAERYDLVLANDALRLHGSVGERELTIETERRGGGKNRYTVTVLRMDLRGVLPQDFSLEPEDLGDKVLRFFGKQDAEIGDARFDRAFDLKNVSPAVAEVLEHEALQQHLFTARSTYHRFFIRDGWLQAELHSVPRRVEVLENLAGPAFMLVHTLEEATGRAQGSRVG